MPELVSILIPCYNAAPWLPATLRSALGQTWPHCEIIVVDDGSKDDSLAVARKICGDSARVISQPNRGASAARNRALRESRGQWIQFLDADDLLAPTKVASQLAHPAARDGNLMLAGRWARFRDAPEAAAFEAELLCRDADPVEWTILKLEHNAMMHPAAWLSPRPVADRAGPWDERLSLDDDGEYFSRLVLGSAGVRYCPEAVSLYRSQIAGSLSTSKSDAAWASALSSLESTAAQLFAREASDRTRHACAVAAQRLIYEAYPASPAVRRRAKKLASAWGGARVEPLGGARFQRLRRLIGWRLARRLQRALDP